MAWYWVVLIAMCSGSLGALMMVIIAVGAAESTKHFAHLEIYIIEDRRAEKTCVEFDGKRFAFPDRLGLPLSDILSSLAIELGHQSNYYLPDEALTDLKRVHRIGVG